MAAEKKKWKIKTIILLHFARLFVTVASPKLLSLGNTKKKLCSFFVLLSFFRNFAFCEHPRRAKDGE